MKPIKQLFNYFISGNVFISIAAISFTLETYLQLHISLHFDGALLLIFFSTFFIYNNHRLAAFQNKKATTEKHVLNINYYKISVLIGIVGIVVSLFLCPFRIFLSLIPFGFISFAYSVPLIPSKRHFLRLREIPGLKIIFISLVWSFTTVLIPVINIGEETIFSSNTLLVFFERALFMYAITIPFDIKDMEKDERENIQTIPLIYGERKAKFSAQLALLIFFLLIIYNYYVKETGTNQIMIILAFLISVFTTTLLIAKSSRSKSISYFLFLLDGTMVLQFLLVLLASYI